MAASGNGPAAANDSSGVVDSTVSELRPPSSVFMEKADLKIPESPDEPEKKAAHGRKDSELSFKGKIKADYEGSTNGVRGPKAEKPPEGDKEQSMFWRRVKAGWKGCIDGPYQGSLGLPLLCIGVTGHNGMGGKVRDHWVLPENCLGICLMKSWWWSCQATGFVIGPIWCCIRGCRDPSIAEHWHDHAYANGEQCSCIASSNAFCIIQHIIYSIYAIHADIHDAPCTHPAHRSIFTQSCIRKLLLSELVSTQLSGQNFVSHHHKTEYQEIFMHTLDWCMTCLSFSL